MNSQIINTSLDFMVSMEWCVAMLNHLGKLKVDNLRLWACTIKLFMAVIYRFLKKARVFVLANPSTLV
jgi:hypothetical protein